MKVLQFIAALCMLAFVSACIFYGKAILLVLILAILVFYGILANSKLI